VVASYTTGWPNCGFYRDQHGGRFHLSIVCPYPGERPDGDEAELLEPHEINVHYVAAMLFFVVFGDNVVRWIDGSETSYWFWLFSGKVVVLTAFGALSVLALFAYWLRLGRVLKGSG